MEYTKFGEEMRVLRARRHQTMNDMAAVLGVTKSCLSGVEKGKRAVPGKWLDILTDHYHLKEYDRNKIKDAIYESRSQIRILYSTERKTIKETLHLDSKKLLMILMKMLLQRFY